MKQLSTYEIRDDIRAIEFNNHTTKLDYYESFVQKARVDENSYMEAFTGMIQFEEAANSRFLESFDLENVRVDLHSHQDQIFRIRVENIQKYQKAYGESLLDGFTVKHLGCAGQIIGCREDSIFVRITQNFEEILRCEKDQEFTINFFTNRSAYKILLNAIQWMKAHRLYPVLIKNERYDKIEHSISKVSEQSFCCPFSATLNDEQATAVKHIVWGQNHGIPMILHGPPGTGKTRTLVASVAEIVRGTNDFVLVVAHSNAACDEITIRLIDILSYGEIFRLYARSFDKKKLNAKIRPICNLIDEEFQFPALKHLYNFRVVVTTLLTAGALVRARGEDADFSSSHFSRIFIDEAGCVHEPASMIPIAGLYTFIIQHFLFSLKYVFVQYSIQVYALNIML